MSDPAAVRFFTIQIVRIIGVGLLVAAMIAGSGRWGPVPAWALGAMIVAGLIAALIAPQRLARRWRSPRR